MATITSDNAATSARWMAPSDWTRHRAEITNLYIFEGRPLHEVALSILHRHGLQATRRMYKNRIKKWGLKKYITGRDARILAQIRSQLRGSEQPFEFMMSGSKVDYARVERHLQRKGLDHLLHSNTKLGETAKFTEELPCSFQILPLSPSLQSPEHLQVVEETLHSLSCWIDGNLESGIWRPNSIGNVADNKAICSVYRFFSEGIRSLQRERVAEGFRLINLAFHSLKPALLEQNSNIVVCLLRLTLGRLKDSHDISRMLWNHILELSSIELGASHPLSRVWRHVASGSLLAGGYKQVSLLAWVVADNMERSLGLCSIAVANSYSQWSNMERLAAEDKHNTEEQKLRKLLDRINQETTSAKSVACRATLQIDLAWILHDQMRYDEVKELLQEVITCPTITDYDLLRAYMLMGQVELGLGNLKSAEICYRERLRLNDAMWGEQDSDSIRSLRDIVRVLTDLSDEEEVIRTNKELDRRLKVIERKQNVELLRRIGDAAGHGNSNL